jgi:putative protease
MAMTEQTDAQEEKPIGEVTHYFGNIGVMAIELTDTLSVGDTIHIKGHTTDFVTTVDSLQVEHESVTEAVPGQAVGIKVTEKARVGDMAYRAQ